MEKLLTKMSTMVDDTIVEYGKIPEGLIEGFEGIVYYIKTNDQENHAKAVMQVISQLESQSYDHGSEWRETKTNLVASDEYYQLSIVAFRIRDSY